MAMRISLIVAMDLAGAIGKVGKLPWRLSTDLKRFKQLTLTHHIVMGRKTFESIGRPLPGRTNLVLSRIPTLTCEGVVVIDSLEKALTQAGEAGENEVFIIGGAQLYALALPRADRIYLTRVQTITPQADTYFPVWDPREWICTHQEDLEADAANEYATTYQVLERIQPANSQSHL